VASSWFALAAACASFAFKFEDRYDALVAISPLIAILCGIGIGALCGEKFIGAIFGLIVFMLFGGVIGVIFSALH